VIIPEVPSDCHEPLPEGGCGHPIPLPPHHPHGHPGGNLFNVEAGYIGTKDIIANNIANDAFQVNGLDIHDNGNNADIM
jgi:hypothetical protein